MDPFNPSFSLLERLDQPAEREEDQPKSSTPPPSQSTLSSSPPALPSAEQSSVPLAAMPPPDEKPTPEAIASTQARRSGSTEPPKNAKEALLPKSSTASKSKTVGHSGKTPPAQTARPTQPKKDAPISFEEALLIGGGSNMPAKAPKPPKTPSTQRPPNSAPHTPHTPRSTTQTFFSSSSLSHAKPGFVPNVDGKTEADVSAANRQSPSTQPTTFAAKMETLPKRNPLAFGVGGSLALSRRPCHDFFYRELLVTRYLSLRSRAALTKREMEKIEMTGLEVDSSADENSRESSPPLLKGELDAMAVAESVRKAIRIRAATVPEHVDDVADDEELGIESLPNKFENEPKKKQLLARIVRVISGQRLADCTAEGLSHGSSVRHASLQRNAALLRKAFSAITSTDLRQGAWAHGYLLQSLPLPFLATYLQLLRHTRQLAPGLVEFVTGHGAGQGDTEAVKDANQLARRLIFHKVTDPLTVTAAKYTPKKLNGNIQLVLVPPTLQHQGKMKQRAHDYFYKVLLPMIGQTHWVKFALPNRNYTVAETADFMLVNIRDTVMEVKKNHRDSKIVLVGWGTSCLLNCKIVQELSAVSAVINFAFPVVCANGSRGDVDDDILTVTAPCLFVVGQFACDSSFDVLQDLRDHMRSESGLIVVGSANSNLYVSPRKLMIERLSLRAVHRLILDHLIEYLDQALNRPHPKPLKFSKPLPALSVDIPLTSAMSASGTGTNSSPKKPRRKSIAHTDQPPKSATPLSADSALPAELVALLGTDPDKPKAPTRLLSAVDASIHPFPPQETAAAARKRRAQSSAVDEFGAPVAKVRKPRPPRPRKPPMKQMSEQGPSLPATAAAAAAIDPIQRRHTIAEMATADQRRFLPVSPQARASLAQSRYITALSSQSGPTPIRYASQPQGQQPGNMNMRPPAY
uniref:KAT8 regulatory NSL complex subunit 3 n=1 Tax=Plectus sambesii TaxID=2011161 RepID=A0A914V3Y6_9BILA